MKYQIDHDYHIHTYLSPCSEDPNQTAQSILEYAKKNGLKNICVTDHFWDEKVEKLTTGWGSNFYQTQTFDYICKVKPLPKDNEVNYYFGCETEMDKNFKIGISKERLDEFDFIIVPTTHMHMDDFSVSTSDYRNPERLAKLWIERIDALLDMDLPFYKIGLAHPLCGLINNESEDSYLKTISLIPQDEISRIFKKASLKGIGIEINRGDANRILKHEPVYNIFRTAKENGCKFYLGSDSHKTYEFNNVIKIFSLAIDKLNLTEDDKFSFIK